MCKSRTTPRDWFKCTRPEHPAHGGVMLCTVQCRPASACARKSPPRGCTLKKQDKTRPQINNMNKISLEDVVGEIWVRGSGSSCPIWRSYSNGEFRSIIGSSIIGIWTISREMGLRDRNVSYFLQFLWSRTGNTCVRAAQRPETGSSAQDLSTLPMGV